MSQCDSTAAPTSVIDSINVPTVNNFIQKVETKAETDLITATQVQQQFVNELMPYQQRCAVGYLMIRNKQTYLPTNK